MQKTTMQGVTYANKHNSTKKSPTIHTFVCIGMHKYTSETGMVHRPHKLWRMDDIQSDHIYWYDKKGKVFIPVCKACNVDM